MRRLLLVVLITLVATASAMGATEEQKQLAIDNGLIWLATTQSRSGSEGWWNYDNDGTIAATASAALAFIEHGFRPGEDVVINSVNYGDVVGLAVTYVFNRAAVDGRFGVEGAGYPHYAEDYNNDGIFGNDGGNDQAIYFNPGNSNRNVYTTGICVPMVYALGQALGRDTMIGVGSAAINGKTYAQALQDLVDWFCWGQVEPNMGNYRGGWRYDANYSSSDNSTAQWGALPLLYGESWEMHIPQYVKTELALWADYIQDDGSGGSGYDAPWNMISESKTGGLLLEFAAIGRNLGDPSVQAALNYLNSHWNNGPGGTWYGNLGHPYAMWAIYKALQVYALTDSVLSSSKYIPVGKGMPAAPGGITIGFETDPKVSSPGDWYSHYCNYLVGTQNLDGSWNGYDYWYGALAGGWYINILKYAGAPPPPCVVATVEEPIYTEGHLTVPISLAEVEDKVPITGIDLIFGYNPDVLVPTGVTFDGTVLDGLGWGHMLNVPEPGEFRVGLAGTTPIPESGMLIYLEFDISATAPCNGTTFLDLYILLNEGEPCVILNDDGWDSWAIPLATVTGEVYFWGCGMLGNDYPPIPGVTVELEGPTNDTAETDASGVFYLSACHDSCYTLTPSKPCGETEGISSLDAALVLRHFVELDDLNECPIQPMEMWDGSLCPPETVYPQQTAADVTGNGEIHSFDASIILKYLVGHDVSIYRVGCWAFYCDSSYFCMEGDLVDGMDFVGLLYGDVSGSYGLVFPYVAGDGKVPELPWKVPAVSDAAVAVGTVPAKIGTTVEVPVDLAMADGFLGLQFAVDYNPALVSVEGVTRSALAGGSLLEWRAEDGVLRIAAASANGIEGNGEFCRIAFHVNGFKMDGTCPLVLENARADERPQLMAMSDGAIVAASAGIDMPVAVSQGFQLHPPVPNPFRPVTTISFSAPAEGGVVEIGIYDVMGRLVRSLQSGYATPGRHTVDWQGVDSRGEKVMSGTYVVRMRAQGREQTQKVTLIQ